MKQNRSLLITVLSLALAFFTACRQPEVVPPPVVIPPDDPEKPEKPPVRPDFNTPYEYDDDMDFDGEAFLAAYTGTPFKEAIPVPGTLEAEDFDNGNNSTAWFESDDMTTSAYRSGHRVDIAANGSASGGYFVGHVQPGEWMAYTIEVAEDGTYSIETTIVKGDGSPGTFHFEVDGRGASRPADMPLGGWEDFSHKATTTGVQLTKGKHILKYCANSPGNVDKMVFTRTGELENSTGSSQYPMARKMSNPLFVDFPSPMFNSALTGNLYTADASAHVWTIDGKERLYVYASHDMEPAVGCDRMDRYHVFSTDDMENWTDHGEILNAATVRKHDGWGSEGFMWAPDCAYNPEDKLYYFYFPHPESTANWNSTWRIGVAVSPYPDKEFRVIGYISGMPPHIDPCVFVDDDGQPYIYNGGGGKYFGGKLKKNDWATLDGPMTAMTGLNDFHEAAWVHKYNGKYYLSHSDNNPTDRGGNRMKYAVSDSPLGPWKDMGVYIYPTGMETNHGSIVRFKGKWWAFYHTSNWSGHGTLRSVCVDPVTMRADGSLEVVRNWGTPHGGGTAPALEAARQLKLEAEKFNDGWHSGYFKRPSRDATVSVASQGGRSYAGDLGTGEWVRYTFEAAEAGKYTVECDLSPLSSGSRVLVSVNGVHPASGGIAVPGATGAWATLTVRDLEVAAGENYLELRVVSGSLNADYFTIKKQ